MRLARSPPPAVVVGCLIAFFIVPQGECWLFRPEEKGKDSRSPSSVGQKRRESKQEEITLGAQ